MLHFGANDTAREEIRHDLGQMALVEGGNRVLFSPNDTD